MKRFLFLFIIFACLHVNALAKTVHAKYIGSVNLSNYQHISLFPSSFVNELYYDSLTRQAVVQLGRTYYMYCNIWEDTILSWKTAYSPGSYYNKNIKGKFSCE